MLEPEAERVESDPYPDYPEPDYEPEYDRYEDEEENYDEPE